MALYLVTGGAGFIGSHLAEELLRRGHRVRIVDNFSTGKRENVAHLPAAEVIAGDLENAVVANEAVAGIDVVLHQAAIASVPRSVSDPIGTNRTNLDATLNVLVAAQQAGVRRVVFAGSAAAYGNAEGLPKREDMPPTPTSPYGLQKVMGEQYGQLFTSLYGLETVTTRYFNVFGPRQDPSSPYSGVISLFISALVDGRRPTIFGDGEQTRDFTYVANVVDAVLRAAAAPGIGGRIVNVATGTRVSLNELFRVLRDIIGGEVTPVYGEPRAGDVRDSQADVSLARTLLGYEPLVALDEGLRRTVAWYRDAAAR
jgi:UDP-glucose 4-epimerase